MIAGRHLVHTKKGDFWVANDEVSSPHTGERMKVLVVYHNAVGNARRHYNDEVYDPANPEDEKRIVALIESDTLPDVVDLRNGNEPVFDQGGLGSSTACAVASALAYRAMAQSKLFTYYHEKPL